MPYTELLKWVDFFNKRPIGWQEDQRTYLLLRSLGYKGSGESLFPSLLRLKQEHEKAQTPDKAVPKGKFLDMMMKAKNGDGFNWKSTMKGK
ncbi:hypothetical protein N9Z41_02495 [bacterium]|nr:hypothetical protein [bacterium]